MYIVHVLLYTMMMTIPVIYIKGLSVISIVHKAKASQNNKRTDKEMELNTNYAHEYSHLCIKF